MQTALIYSNSAANSVFGVAMIALLALVDGRPAWVSPKHPR